MTLDARTGQVLAGRYRIVRRIGEGGMGTVFEAERVDGGKRVAIKTLHAHLANDQEIVARFKREAIAASSIGDPHIVARSEERRGGKVGRARGQAESAGREGMKER